MQLTIIILAQKMTMLLFVILQGCSPTVVRAMVVNAAQLATYSQAKQYLLSTGIAYCVHTIIMLT